jgi:iron transport multicopper oxidase
MTADFGNNANGQYRAYINGIDYIPQVVPTLYTAMNAPANLVNNPAIYGQNANAWVLPYMSVVEVTLQNHDSYSHPFHLHGHNFQVVARDPGGPLFPINPPAGPPMRRDTVLVMGDGSVTIRFIANNPGINLFHCHIEWHVEAGLTATFVEAPTQIQAYKLYIPASHRDACTNQSIPRTGNAAGNAANYLNLAGAPVLANTSMWGYVFFVIKSRDAIANDCSSLVNPPSSPAPPYPLG